MFEYPIHNQVLKVLKALRSDFLSDCQTYLGGGTQLALNYGEYRLSRDIDFLCPYGPSFSQLRRSIYDRGQAALFDATKMDGITLPREIRTDRDGLRLGIQVDAVILKLEIVAEGRISLAAPSYPDWSPVACLSVVDQIAEKLLANGDRWADASTDSRDLIDLAILKLATDWPEAAMAKAEAALPTLAPLKCAIANFAAKPDYRSHCYQKLRIRNVPLLIDGLDQLAASVGLPLIDRTTMESAV
jgi:Nucleotidyl transferase AbiEii toxin, Type IV TA system